MNVKHLARSTESERGRGGVSVQRTTISKSSSYAFPSVLRNDKFHLTWFGFPRFLPNNVGAVSAVLSCVAPVVLFVHLAYTTRARVRPNYTRVSSTTSARAR